MPVSSPAHVVVVDDDPDVRGALRFAFETEGYAVSTFGSGEALLALAGIDAEACFIVDQRLPGVSGLETLLRLRARGVAAPAFLVTSNPSAPLKRGAAAARAEIVEKPLLGDALARRVRAALLR